jgi:adenylate cyclase class 2
MPSTRSDEPDDADELEAGAAQEPAAARPSGVVASLTGNRYANHRGSTGAAHRPHAGVPGRLCTASSSGAARAAWLASTQPSTKEDDVTRPIEVERKRELADGGEALTRALAELGWTARPPVAEVDTYYSHPDVDYMETVECLRVRQRGDFAEVTYKPASTADTHRADSVISKPETNVHLAPGQVSHAAQLLECIGMRKLVRVDKHRTGYRHRLHPGATVSIDTVIGVGVFVETEVISADADTAARIVGEMETQLGVSHCPVVDLPYRDLAMSHASA